MKKIKEKPNTKSKKAKEKAKRFNKEIRKAIYTALIAAFGFLIAFVWRDLIQLWVEKVSSKSPVQGQLISALIVTIVCVIGILIVTRFLKANE